MGLKQKFQESAGSVWQGSGLQHKFHQAGNYISPAFWARKAGEKLLGDAGQVETGRGQEPKHGLLPDNIPLIPKRC